MLVSSRCLCASMMYQSLRLIIVGPQFLSAFLTIRSLDVRRFFIAFLCCGGRLLLSFFKWLARLMRLCFSVLSLRSVKTSVLGAFLFVGSLRFDFCEYLCSGLCSLSNNRAHLIFVLKLLKYLMILEVLVKTREQFLFSVGKVTPWCFQKKRGVY